MLIYKVTNLENGKVYIGLTGGTLEQRKYKHEYDAQRQDRKTVKFHNALLKYGFDSFKWEVLKECSSQEELDEAEIYYISLYNACDREKGYNLKSGGKIGRIYTDEAKQNIGESTKRKWQNPETAARMREGLKKATEAWKQKCLDNRIKHICPICGKEFYTAHHNSHTYCSNQCANIAILDEKRASLKKATEINKENYEINRKNKILLVEEWVKNNKNLLTNIKWNKLTFINDLCQFINVKDPRTVAKLFNLTNRKDLVKKLIEISENIC